MKWVFLIPGSFVYFLSGIFASAGVNVLTGLLDYDGAIAGLLLRILLVVSTIVASVFLGLAAWQIDSVNSQLRDLGVQHLTATEMKDVIKRQLLQQSRALNLKIACALIAMLAGIGAIVLHVRIGH